MNDWQRLALVARLLTAQAFAFEMLWGELDAVELQKELKQ